MANKQITTVCIDPKAGIHRIEFFRGNSLHSYRVTNWHRIETIDRILKDQFVVSLVNVLSMGHVSVWWDRKPDTKPAQFFTVSEISREDFTERGFDVSRLSDEDMRDIARYMGDNESSMESFWETLEYAAEKFDIPKLADNTPVKAQVIPCEPEIEITYNIIARNHYPMPDGKQVTVIAVMGFSGNDWAAYMGITDQKDTYALKRKTEQQIADSGLKLFEHEALGMFPGLADIPYRR